MITMQRVTSNVQSVPCQSPDIDTPNCVLEDRVQHSTVHIPSITTNSNYVITVTD
jgi:hypothetical protein